MEVLEKETKDSETVSFVNLLGGKTLIKTAFVTDFDLIALSQQGITKASLESLIAYIGVSKKKFIENILDLSVKTIERKKNDDRLGQRISSHILEIAKVVAHAFAVFEDEAKVQKWLITPNRALNNIQPVDLFVMPTGLNMVDQILGRIEEGVYS